jgi:hypothetical protein
MLRTALTALGEEAPPMTILMSVPDSRATKEKHTVLEFRKLVHGSTMFRVIGSPNVGRMNLDRAM